MPSPGPYLVKVFLGSVIRPRGAALSGPTPAGPPGPELRPRPGLGPPRPVGAESRPPQLRRSAPPAPLRGRGRPALRGRLARRGPRPDGVTFPVHPAVDASSQRGSKWPRGARGQGAPRLRGRGVRWLRPGGPPASSHHPSLATPRTGA